MLSGLTDKLAQERRARLAAERLLEQKKKELFSANQKLALHARSLSDQIVQQRQGLAIAMTEAEALKGVAERLGAAVREVDTVSRHGGDEFLVLVMGVRDKQSVSHLAQKIASHIQAPCQLFVGQVSIKLSIGIARFPQDGDSAEALVKQADTAMYKAKHEGAAYGFAS
mgnify:CR=1 FL=1